MIGIRYCLCLEEVVLEGCSIDFIAWLLAPSKNEERDAEREEDVVLRGRRRVGRR